ncbi:hypothetical protein ACUXVT_15405 [Acinetobacter soli]|uniref:hypothetical protein n=1 Tax=Acinetobacter soli TaxID=487316 RepID=UPI0040568E47
MSGFSILNGTIQSLTQNEFKDHDDFLFNLYRTVDRACKKISSRSKKISRLENIKKIHDILNRLDENDKKELINFISKTLEDDISIRIVDIISENLNFRVSHEGYHNGRVDILVDSWDYMHKWLGEAKIYSGPAYTEQGLKQLLYDYSKGELNESGGILIYVDSTNLGTTEIIKNWETKLLELSKNPDHKLKNIQFEYDSKNPRVLFTQHIHHLSKEPYKIRHFCVDLRDIS